MALRQRVALVLLLSVSLFTMVMSILKTVGLKTIADQQSDPTATDVQYNATLKILWSLLEQACVIIMGCVPPLRAIMKFEMMKSVFTSLVSLMRPKETSKKSSSAPPYKGNSARYEDLEMQHDFGRVRGNPGYSDMDAGSQHNLVRPNGISKTMEFNVSHHPH